MSRIDAGPATPAQAPAALALEATGVSRSFGGVQALRGASFAARPGQVHALAGENGAGKSTMIKVLSGVLRPDAGTVRVFGEAVRFAGPAEALRWGIATAFQELSLLPDLTVAENLLLRTPPRGRLGLVRRARFTACAGELLERHGVTDIDPNDPVDELSVAQRQVVEIVRALSSRPRILFLDEPTAALPDREVEWLRGQVVALRDAGGCVVFTSHRWRDIEELADRVTVFRNGTDVASADRLGRDEAVTLMAGRSVDQTYPPLPAARSGEPALRVAGLSAGRLRDVSFTLHRGEVLGVGGLAGQGQRELFLALFGVRPADGGSIEVGGRAVRLRRPRQAVRAGVALVPEDRKGEGLTLPLSVRDNLTLPVLNRIARAGLLRRARERHLVRTMVDQLQIDTRRPRSQTVRTLSGGNQQKVLLGRWLLTDPAVLLLYDVTRGVDAATKHDIYRLVAQLAKAGKAILLYSSETEEMAHLCHRVLVLREGRLAAELPGPVGDPELIVAAAMREGTDA
jgi:ribose transport system ATP-binding protein